MKVCELIEQLKKLPEDANVYVSCQGWNNYDPEENSGYWDGDETQVVVVDGKAFVADSCYIEWEGDLE